RLPPRRRRQRHIIGGGASDLDGEGDRPALRLDRLPDLANRLGAGGERQGVLHRVESHSARSHEHIMASPAVHPVRDQGLGAAAEVIAAGTTAGTVAPSSSARRGACLYAISLSSRVLHVLRVFAADRCPGPASPGAIRVFVFVSAVSVWGKQ